MNLQLPKSRRAPVSSARPRKRVPSPVLRRAAIEALESRRLLVTTAINPADAIPFQQIIIDPNPGNTPVVKLLVDITNSGTEDAVVGHETTTGGAGLDWYQYPASGNPTDPWIEHVIDPTADVYEAARAADISGNVDSNGNPVNDLIVCERESIYWYENPLGLGEDPTTAAWPKFLIGTISQGVTHELYLADLEGTGHLDVITNDAIFFPNYTSGQSAPTSWTQVATPNFDRTEKGLYLFNSGSGLGDVDLLGTGNAPHFQVGWWENPRDTGGNARTGTWTFHAIGPAYGNYVAGDGVSYATMDVTGDGQEDIITCDGENGPGPADGGVPFLTGGLIWWQRPANVLTGTWIPHTIDASLTDVHNLVIADMSGDGQDEILAFEQDQSPQGRLMIIYNEGGTGQNWLEQTIASDSDPAAGGGEGGHNESVGDATGDGFLDILTSPHGFYTGVNPISLFLNDIPSDGIVEPNITSAPSPQTAAVGSQVTFSVSATSTGPLTYQWEQNGLDIPGATLSSYTVPVALADDNGSVYRCIVGNPAGLIPSPGATLTTFGTANGLVGNYYRDTTDAAPWLTRLDSSLDFSSGLDLPRPLKTAAVDWAGNLVPDKSGQYNFYLLTNGTAKLYINGVPVTYEVGKTRHVIGAQNHLLAGHTYYIEVKYVDSNSDTPVLRLLWNGTAITKQIIPTHNLFTL